MITLILFISFCNALLWAGGAALLAKAQYVPFVFVGAFVVPFLLLCFITSAWRGEPWEDKQE